MKKKNISRRKFLGQASCAGVGYTTLLSTLCNLKVMNAATMANSSVLAGDDYKALICIMFGGGNDSFNMIIPTDTTRYNSYSNIRTNLALPKDELHDLTGSGFAVHPAMPEVAQLFNDGKLAFLNNVGTLVEPLDNKYQIWNGSKARPLGLYSHSDQSQQWQTSIPHDRSAIGWGGKMADLLATMNPNQNISMNISLSGSNTFQKGNNGVEYTIDAYRGSVGITGYDDPWQFGLMRKQAIDNILESTYEDMFRQAYVDVVRISRDSHLQFKDAIDNVAPFNTSFSDSYISESMHMIAKVIAARDDLSLKRQIFFIDYGGWDHHDEVLQAQDYLLGMVSKAMTELYSALDEINMNDCVTTFTMSEFGRTMTSNGNGTDHGWGGNVMMMGGAVNGGQVYGQYPDLTLGSDIDLGGGVYVPSTSPDEYFAELALWFGVSSGDLADLFPNIGNFYSPGGSQLPIGFLNV